MAAKPGPMRSLAWPWREDDPPPPVEGGAVPLRLATEQRDLAQLRRAETIVLGLRWLAVLSWPAILYVTEIPWDPRLVWPVWGAVLAYVAATHAGIRYLPAPIRNVAVATTVGDSIGITIMCLVTGGIDSDIYFVFHLAVLATALRFGMRETFAVLALNATFSFGLFAVRPGPLADLGVRLFYMAFIALMGALLSREVHRHYRRALIEGDKASLLLSVNREITSTLDLVELLRRVLQEAIQVLPCAGAGIVLLDRSGTGVERVVVAGDLPQPDPAEVQASLVSGVLRDARETGPVILNRPEEARPRLRSEAVRQLLSRNLAVIPIRRRAVLGYLILVDKHGDEPFNAEETSLLGAVADQAAVAIENARLVEEARTARDRHRDLLWRTFRAGEEERRRIAGEIHDDVGGQLYELLYGIQRARDQLAHGASDAPAALEALEQRAKECTRLLRGVMNDLRPSVLDDLGFVEALREYVSALQAQGELTVKLRIDEPSDPVPVEIGTMLFRVLQEAVLNVRKHAGAKNLHVELSRGRDGRLALTVRDDGRGFDPDGRAHGHYGLLYMRERSEACGGELEVRSRPGKGTEIRVIVPAGGSAA